MMQSRRLAQAGQFDAQEEAWRRRRGEHQIGRTRVHYHHQVPMKKRRPTHFLVESSDDHLRQTRLAFLLPRYSNQHPSPSPKSPSQSCRLLYPISFRRLRPEESTRARCDGGRKASLRALPLNNPPLEHQKTQAFQQRAYHGRYLERKLHGRLCLLKSRQPTRGSLVSLTRTRQRRTRETPCDKRLRS